MSPAEPLTKPDVPDQPSQGPAAQADGDAASPPRPSPTVKPLPDPDEHPGTDVVIFDGQCRFCQGQVRNLWRFDCCGPRLSFLSLHDPRVAQRYNDLSHDELMAQMYVIDTRGHRYGGSDAVRYLSRRLPLLWPAMPLLHLPGTARLWRWLYNQVAQRRYWISGKAAKGCDDDACSIHLNRR